MALIDVARGNRAVLIVFFLCQNATVRGRDWYALVMILDVTV